MTKDHNKNSSSSDITCPTMYALRTYFFVKRWCLRFTDFSRLRRLSTAFVDFGTSEIFERNNVLFKLPDYDDTAP